MAGDALFEVLPEVFQVATEQSLPLQALVAVTEDMQRPVREQLDRVETIVDPYRTPASLVPYLSTWVDLDWLTMPGTDLAVGPVTGVPTSRQRDLIANAAALSAQRGTTGGLTRFLRLATGVDGFDVQVISRRFHMRVVVPAAAADRMDLVARIVAGIKPAHMTHELVPASADAPPPEPTDSQ